jgi:hypothetical protein
MHGRSRTTQAACDAVSCANTFVREKPLCALGTVAAVGIFVGALLSLRKYEMCVSPGLPLYRLKIRLPCPAVLIIVAISI